MHAIEFEADIENGVIRLPAIYHKLPKTHARIIVLTDAAPTCKQATAFNPRLFFGVGRQSKAAIDAYLQEARAGWQ